MGDTKIEGKDGKKEAKIEWKSNVEFFTNLSADGRFIICKHVITTVKPVQYFAKVMQGKSDKLATPQIPT